MAAEIPPDYFPTSPTLSGAGAFPDNMPAPDAGIFDAPAHVAIINQYWVTRLLGMLDGLMYPEAWEAEDAELAYNELLELQAMLMSPANFLIPSDTYQGAINLTNLPSGTTQANMKTVPPGKRILLQSASIMFWAGTVSNQRITVNASGKTIYLVQQTSPASLQMYNMVNPVWLYAGDTVAYQISASTVVNGLWVALSGTEYDEA